MRLSAESVRAEAPDAILSRLATGLLEAGRRGDRLSVLELAGDGGAGPPGEPDPRPWRRRPDAAGEVARALDSYRRRGGTLAACSGGRVDGLLLELALSADVHLAAEGTRFVLPGLFDDYLPGLGAWTRLVGRAGSARARALLLCPVESDDAAGIGAREALAAGICDIVVASGQMAATVSRIQDALERSSPPAAEVARRLGGRRRSFGFLTARQERLLESASFSLCFASEHPGEGIDAFFEERAPQFHSTKDER